MLPFCSLVLTPTSKLHNWCGISILESSDLIFARTWDVITRFGHIEKDRRGCSVGVGNTMASHESEKMCKTRRVHVESDGITGRGATNCFRYPYLLHFQLNQSAVVFLRTYYASEAVFLIFAAVWLPASVMSYSNI